MVQAEDSWMLAMHPVHAKVSCFSDSLAPVYRTGCMMGTDTRTVHEQCQNLTALGKEKCRSNAGAMSPTVGYLDWLYGLRLRGFSNKCSSDQSGVKAMPERVWQLQRHLIISQA